MDLDRLDNPFKKSLLLNDETTDKEQEKEEEEESNYIYIYIYIYT